MLSWRVVQKLVNREYNKMTGDDEQVDIMADGRAGEDDVDDEGKKKNKNKPPNMLRLLKSRLQKLVNKTDET
jgi:stress response protein SCP2